MLNKANTVGAANKLKKSDGNVCAARASQKQQKQNLSIIFEHFGSKFVIFLVKRRRRNSTPTFCIHTKLESGQYTTDRNRLRPSERRKKLQKRICAPLHAK